MTVQEAEDVVLQTYYRNRTYGNVNMKRFMDWNCVRERVVFKLVNLYTNEEMLSDIPYLRFLDLALVPLVMVKRDGESVATITIHSQYMKLWGISEGELFDAARANTPKLLGYELRSMNSILCDILDNAEEEYDPDELNGICSETKMFILTNKNRIDGAVCITYPNLLHDISVKLESDLYVIPSSTHETIITPKYDDISVEDINVMIREINENIVSEKPEEVLSNHVYIYKMDEDRLTM
jgi:hypothetical protein